MGQLDQKTTQMNNYGILNSNFTNYFDFCNQLNPSG
jgi:hypothetical protein